MSHCKECDVELTDFEATRKVMGTDVYLDLCTLCYLPISGEIRVAERYDLLGDGDTREYEGEGTADYDDEDTPDRYVEETSTRE